MNTRPGAVLVVFAVFGAFSAGLLPGQDLVGNYAEPDRSLVCPNCNHQLPRLDVYGWRGRPWRDREPGGCLCGRRHGITFYNADCHWPSPFSVLVDHGRHGQAWRCTTDTTRGRPRDLLDHMAYIRLLPPVRRDNGYVGRDCDPFGYVGRSRAGAVLPVEYAATHSTGAAGVAQAIPPGLASVTAAKTERQAGLRSPRDVAAIGPARLPWHYERGIPVTSPQTVAEPRVLAHHGETEALKVQARAPGTAPRPRTANGKVWESTVREPERRIR